MQNLLKIVSAYNAIIDTGSASRIDELVLSKQILTSQPPRAQDVPDMVAYTLKWGGLPSGKYIKTLCEEFKAAVPSDRVVSGGFFRKLADLKFPPSELPSNFLNAALICHAEAAENVQDELYARFITLAEVDGFANKKCRAKLLKYDQLLSRSCTMTANGSSASQLPSSFVTKVTLKFKINMVRHFLERKATMEKFKDVNDIVKLYTAEIAAGKFIEEKGTAAAPPTSREPAHNVVLYDEESGGAIDVGKLTVENLGFKVGNYVCKNGKGDTPMEQWTVTHIGDEYVHIMRIDDDGNTVKSTSVDGSGAPIDPSSVGGDVIVGIDDFCTSYKRCEKLKVMEGFNGKCITNDKKEINVLKYKSMVMMCMIELHGKHVVNPEEFRMLEKPIRMIASRVEKKKGMLVIAPISLGIVVKDPKTTYSTKLPEVTIDIAGAPSFVVSPPGGDDLSIFFAPKVVGDEDKANLVFRDEVMCVKMPSEKGRQNKNPTIEVTIPCIVNSKDIKVNDELVLYRPQPTKKDEKKRVMATVESVRPVKRKV